MKDFKNFIKPILFLTISLMVLSLFKSVDFRVMMTKIQNNIQEGMKVVKVTGEKSEINDENLNIKFKVPSIQYENKEVEKSINSYVKRNIKEFINVQRQINKLNPHGEKYTLNITYNVVFENEDLINIVIDKNATWGNKNYKLEKDSYVFSLKNGERIYLDDFFKNNENYSEVITEIIKKNIDSTHPLYNKLNIDKNTNYYIGDKFINIYFNPYRHCGDNTQYEFKIPYDAFENKIEAFNNFFLVNVKKKIIKKNNKYLESTLEIPNIVSANENVKKVNSLIEKDILNFYNTSLKEAQNYLEDFSLDNSNFVADSTFEIKKNRDDVISILVRYYKYSGGAHGYYEYIPYNIDLRNGKLIVLKDIFKDNVDYKILINNEIKEQIKELGKKTKEDVEKIYDFYGIKENQKFYFDDSKVVIFFDLYDIAPYAAGIPEFPIPFEKIETNTKEEYLNLIK